MPSYNPNDPEYRRLHYVRYADDTLLGFVGPREEAEEIKQKLGAFLREQLKLELSEEKTLITHAHTQKARFLGYEIAVQHQDDKHDLKMRKRVINGTVALRIPLDVIERRCQQYMQDKKPAHRPELMQDEDFTIISRYQAESRGLVEYSLPAQNVSALAKLHWVMETSLLKTLANKHQVTMMHMGRKYRSTAETPNGSMKCLKMVIEREGKKPLVAQLGGIPLKQREKARLVGSIPFKIGKPPERNELIRRLLASKCELCGTTEDIEVHHIRKLADIAKRKGEQLPWMKIMSMRRRKTLVVCQKCHKDVHAGRPRQSNRK